MLFKDEVNDYLSLHVKLISHIFHKLQHNIVPGFDDNIFIFDNLSQ